MIHGFTCAGMLPTQFIKLSRFAGIGTVKHGYISRGFKLFVVVVQSFYCVSSLVYNHCGYIEVVSGLAEKSMQAAVDEVKMLAEYSANGEVIVIGCSGGDFYSALCVISVGHY